MNGRSTSSYQPLRRTGGLALRWHLLRRLPRIQPAWPWWAAFAGGATAVTVLLDLLGRAPWWLGPPTGLVLGAVAVALTALDDLRRPVASLRVLSARVRSPGQPAPGGTERMRAEVFDIPLYAPPRPGLAVRFAGGGATSGGRLFAPIQCHISLRWRVGEPPNGDGDAEGGSTTSQADPRDDHHVMRWTLGPLLRAADDGDPERDPLAEVDWRDLERRRTELPVVLDGRRLGATAIDLTPEGAGWAATVRGEGHVVDVWGAGPMPPSVELVRCDPATLTDGWDESHGTEDS